MARGIAVLLQDAFKLQAAMLRECASYKPSNSAVQATLKWAFADMEEAAARQTAFSLLKVCTWFGASRGGEGGVMRGAEQICHGLEAIYI